MNCELPDVQAGLEKAEEPEIKLPTSSGSWKKQESFRKTSISALLPMPKPLTVFHIVKGFGVVNKAREFQKNIYFCFIDYAKAFDCVDHNKLWKILKEMGIPDHLTCLLRNLYAGQEATVRTAHGTTDWFQIGKGIRQAVYCHPAYLTYMQSTS